MKSSFALVVFILPGIMICSSCAFISQNKTKPLTSIDSATHAFKDYNKIISFVERNSTLLAETANGVLNYDPIDDKWSLSDSIHLQQSDKVNAMITENELPDGYEKSAYTDVIKQHNEWLLVGHGNEELGYKQEIVNTIKKKIYRFPYECINDFIVKDETMWIGSVFGISKININTLERADYRILPAYKEIINSYEFPSEIYYLDYEYGLFLYNKQRKQVYPIDEINSLAYEDNFKFINSGLINNVIYIVAVRMEKCAPYLIKNACLLTFNLESRQAKKIETQLPYFDSFLLKDSHLFCYGEYQQLVEGGDYTYYGGVVSLNLENNQLTTLSNIPIVSLIESPKGVDAISMIDYGYYNFLVSKKEHFYIDSLNCINSNVEFNDTTYCKFAQGFQDNDTIYLENDAMHKRPKIINNSRYATQAQQYQQLKEARVIKKDTVLTNLNTKITMMKVNRNKIEIDKY
jgi:hypothetical protein